MLKLKKNYNKHGMAHNRKAYLKFSCASQENNYLESTVIFANRKIAARNCTFCNEMQYQDTALQYLV